MRNDRDIISGRHGRDFEELGETSEPLSRENRWVSKIRK